MINIGITFSSFLPATFIPTNSMFPTGGVIQPILRLNTSINCSSYPQTHEYLNEEITIAGFISTGIDQCIAIVPNLEILDGFKIKKLNINHKDAHRDIYLAIANNRPMPNCVKLFYDFIKQNYIRTKE